MSTDIDVQHVGVLKITPKLLAEAFWKMSDSEQAEFYECLYNEANKTYEEYVSSPQKSWWTPTRTGDMQWCYMRDAIKKRGEKAEKMYMAMSVFAFDYFPARYEIR